MARWTGFAITPLFCFCLLTGCTLDTPLEVADPPIRVENIGIRNLKPPMRSYSFHLELVNEHDKPAWFVFPYFADEPVPDNGVFVTKNWKDQPFGGQKYKGKGGAAIEVFMYGGNGFKAFLLPAKGQLELEGYSIDTCKDINEIVVLEASDLKVNGKTSLDRWLPFATTCDEKVKISRPALSINWENLDWDAKKLGSRDDYPKEKVKEIKADGFRSWTVKLKKEEDEKDSH